MQRYLKSSFSLILLFLIAGLLPGQNPVSTIQPGPRLKMQKIGTINLSQADDEWDANMYNITKVIPEGNDVNRDLYKAAKAEANRLAGISAQTPTDEEAQKTAAIPPTVHHTFFGNQFDGIPNDNSMASGRNGTVVSATNSRVYIYTTAGAQITMKTLASFYSTSAIKYDPKVTFDRGWNRYVLVYLVGDQSSTSNVIVCFSETDDPSGNWHIYSIPGNANPGTFGACWADFPQIGLNLKELFVTVNLFSNSDVYQGGYIFQINKEQGFRGEATVDIQGYSGSGNNYFAISPAEGNASLYGPQMYMVSTRGSSFGSTSVVNLHVISDSIHGTPTLQSYQVFANQGYSISPSANQKGTTVKLDTRDTRVRSSFYHDGKIYFGMNCAVQNKPGIYVGIMDGLNQPQFAAVNGIQYKTDSFEIGYPGLAYGGRTSANGDHSILMFFDIASTNHYPGNAVVYFDTNHVASNPVVCKYGASSVNSSGDDPERWGDYADASPNPDNPGEIFGAGYYGYGGGKHGTWIAHIYGPDVPTIGVEPDAGNNSNVEMTVFPNPSVEQIRIRFDVPLTANYRVEISDINGRKIATVLQDRLVKGKAEARFETDKLNAGTYLVSILGDDGIIHSEKFIVTK